MDGNKLANFMRSHPGMAPPAMHRLSVAEASELFRKLARRFDVAGDDRLLALRALLEGATPVDGPEPEDDEFDLSAVFDSISVAPDASVFVNWDQFESVDRMRSGDLVRFFTDVWYPGADDIELFDQTFNWILFVPHSGPALLSFPAH